MDPAGDVGVNDKFGKQLLATGAFSSSRILTSVQKNRSKRFANGVGIST